MAYLSLLVMIASTLMQYHFVYAGDVTEWCINDLEDPYLSVLDFVNSQNITEDELQSIIDTVLTRAGCYWLQNDPGNDMNCSDCMHASDIYRHYFNKPANSTLSAQEFHNVSVILMSYVYQPTVRCSTANQTDWTTVTYSYFTEQLLNIADMFSDPMLHPEDKEMFTVGQLETLLRNVSDSYIPGQNLNKFTAVRPQDVASTCTFASLRSIDSYLLMDAVSTNHSETIEKDRLDLLSSYVISQLLHGSCISTANPDVANANGFVQSIYETFGACHSCVFNETGIIKMMSQLGLNTPEHDHDHSVTEHHTTDNTTQHSDVASQYHRIDVKNTCLDIDDIFASFNIENTDEISRTDFYKLCPALIQQAVIGCTSETTSSDFPKPSAAEVYGYGTVAVFIICALSAVGLIIVKLKNTKVYDYLLVAMLGLAVGSLVGDALIHLVPEALGLHDHEHEHEDSSHGTGVTVEDFTWKMIAGCGSVWMFYVLQISLLWIERIMKRRSSKLHTVTLTGTRIDNGAISMDNLNNSTTAIFASETRSVNDSVGNDRKPTQIVDVHNDDAMADNASLSSSHGHVHPTVAWMVTVGDALHNLTDGLAIGASFQLGWSTGLSTSIAVACHELPHEFGDTAILLSAGWSPLKVLIFQLVSASTAFIGLYAGIGASEGSEVVQQWIFIVAAGMFLYVALTDVLPELIEYFRRGNALMMFLASNGGIFLGFLAMALLAIYEEKIVINKD